MIITIGQLVKHDLAMYSTYAFAGVLLLASIIMSKYIYIIINIYH